MIKQALEEIQHAEEEAAEVVARARHEANQLREKTVRQAREATAESRRDVAERRDALIAEGEARGKKRAEEVLDANRTRIGDLLEGAEANRAAAVEAIARRLSG